MQLRKLLLIVFTISMGYTSWAQNTPTADSASLSAMRSRALALDSMVRNNPDMQTSSIAGNPDGLTLPIGIVKELSPNGVIAIICIDSARFTPNGATFDVYMALDWPGTKGKLAFAAKGISFNPKGVMPGSSANEVSLKLIGDQTLQLGPKNKLIFKGDGTNFINWNCDGYQSASVNVEVHFSKDIIQTPQKGTVVAQFGGLFKDASKAVFTTTFPKFMSSKLDEFIFELDNVVVDFSDSTNAIGFQLPNFKQNDFPVAVNWTGFYAQNLSVTLPKKLSKNNNAPVTFGAQNLFIDDQGVSGDFYANNLFAMGEGNMNKWDFSLDSVVIGVENNKLVEGRLAGKIKVPQFKEKPIVFAASVTKVNDTTDLVYNFMAKVPSNTKFEFEALNSELTLSSCAIFMKVQNDNFVPKLVTSGKIKYQDKAKFVLGFQNLTITSEAPYLTGGVFTLTDSSQTPKMAKLPIMINSITLGFSQQEIVFGMGLSIKAGKEGDFTFTASSGFKIYTKRENSISNSTREDIKYDRFKIENVRVLIESDKFNLDGTIAFKDNDPVYGDMFYGNLGFKFPAIMDDWASASLGFGEVNGFKYWLTDLKVPTNINIGQLKITNLLGGVSARVRSDKTPVQLMDDAFNSNQSGDYTPNLVIPFVPDSTKGLAFMAGLAMESSANEAVFNGEALLQVAFNANGGLETINLSGRAYMLTKRADRAKPNSMYAKGELLASYNHTNKVFHTTLDVYATAPSVLEANCNLVVHIEDSLWYFWLNRPAQRAQVNLLNVFQANAYFMVGEYIDPIPAPPSYVTNLVNSSSIISTNMSQITQGQGFATGAQVSVDFNGEFPKTTKWRGYVDFGLGAGFDVTMLKLPPNSHCVGETRDAGMNGWIVNGQVYLWFNGSLGAKKYDDDGDLKNTYSLGSIAGAALLQGTLPNPTFVYGAVGFSASVLGIIDFDFTASIELGNSCAIVQN